jgi:hypothetical protein
MTFQDYLDNLNYFTNHYTNPEGPVQPKALAPSVTRFIKKGKRVLAASDDIVEGAKNQFRP